jgi:hypothetical protein
MNIYSIALFLHITGALGFFSAFALEWLELRQIQQATLSDQVQAWIRILAGTRRLGTASMSITLISGIYMTVTTWHRAAWIMVALASIFLLIPLVMILARPGITALGKSLNTEKGMLSQGFRELANHRLLEASIRIRVAIALGIVFLMTVKPELKGSLLTMATAVVIGLAWGMYMPNRKQTQKEIPN